MLSINRKRKTALNLSTRHVSYFLFFFFLFVFLVSATSVYPADDPTIEYRVIRKDGLIKISERILEDPSKWREVAKINRLKDPYIIQPDQMLVIPVRLLKGSPMDGIVTFIKGESRIQKLQGGEWIALKHGDAIKQGDTIKTEVNGTLEVTFEDKSTLFMRPNTLLTVTISQKKGALAIVKSINLKSGKAISDIKRATGTESRYEVTTPSAIASARGTGFRISIDDLLTTRAEVVDGRIIVSAQGVSVEVKDSEGTVVERGTPPVRPVRLVDAPRLIDRRPIYKDIPLGFRFDVAAGTKSIRATLSKDKDGREIVFEGTIKPDEQISISNLEDGSYYLISYGIDAMGLEGIASEAVEIKYRANPFPPFIQIKDEGTEFIGKSADFKWLNVKDAVAYHIQIAKDREFKSIIVDTKDYRGVAYKTETLDYGDFYFRVCSVAVDGYEGGWSNVIRFRLIPPPPSPPLEKPSIDKNSIFLKWRNLGEGITYHFQMAKDEGFKEILLDTRLEKSEITLKKPKDPGTYYVRTSSIDKKGREGSFSTPQGFEIERGFPYKAIGIIMGLGLLSLFAF